MKTMMMMTKKKCRKKPERPMIHRREGDDTPQYKQIPKTTQYKSTQMEKCLRVRIPKIIIDGQTEIPIDRTDTVAYFIKKISGYEKTLYVTGQLWNRTKGTPQPLPGDVQKPQDFLPSNMTLPTTSSSP